MVHDVAADGSSVDEGTQQPSPTVSGFAEAWWDFQRIKSDFEDGLREFFLAAAAGYERIGTDSYDCSIEIYGVSNDFRLSDESQRFIEGAGFAKCYVNHQDGWETHYTWKTPFAAVSGWRVRYGHKQEPRKEGLEVETVPPSWRDGAAWVKSGYVKIVAALRPDGAGGDPRPLSRPDDARNMDPESPEGPAHA